MKKNYYLILIVFFAFVFKSNAVNSKTPLTITNAIINVASYTDKEVTLEGKSELHLTGTSTTLNNSTVNLTNDDSWLFFDNIRPNDVINSLLQYVTINGQSSVLKANVRVSVYKQGTVVIPHSSSFQPLKVYTSQNYNGDSASYSLFTYNNTLPANIDNHIRSFKLKRGYMATLATSADGTGYSRVFIADDKDITMNIMPTLLDEKVSFIRVFSWEYVSKKGWCGSDPNQYGKVKATWRYDWSAGGNSTNAIEYVPIKQNLSWPGWSEIDTKQYVTHALGYNEPDHTEQSNVTVAQAVKEWPNMLKSGLRIGSPACTNFSWLYQFMDSCKAHNYRVDYVAVHSYWGGKSPQNWYNDLKYISQRTGRPIWITEWNNGANWTTEWWPTSDKSLSAANAAKQLNDIKAILNVLDTASFIERYSIYNWVQDCRAMVLADTLTPAGKYYADNNSVMAFNRNYEVIPTFTLGDPSLSISFGTKSLSLTESDPNEENFNGFIAEKKIDEGEYNEVYNSDDRYAKTYIDTLDLSIGNRIRYRVKAKMPDGTLSNYTNELGYDVTTGGEVQCGKLLLGNVDWNSVFFKDQFPKLTIPAIILGSPTNANNTTLMSPRVKLISATSRFNVQLSPWSYQNITSLSKEESVPYLALKPGTYDFGGLKAIAGKNTVGSGWTKITFATAFNTIPVVFTSQLFSSTTFATTVRVRNVTTTGFEAKLQKESTIATSLASETVSFFAIEQGTGLMDGRKVIVGKTADTDIKYNTYKTISFGDSIPNPIFIAQMQTCNDDTVTATMRCLSISDKYASVMKQRERSTGQLTTLAEGAGWMVIDPMSILQGINEPTLDKLSFYPNPVTDFICLNGFSNQAVEIEIYNLCGILFKKIDVTNGKIDVSDLSPGCYLIKTKNSVTNKFVKL